MPIIVNVDVMLAKRKMTSGELAEKVGITQANLSILKTGKAKAVRFSTLEAICGYVLNKCLNSRPHTESKSAGMAFLSWFHVRQTVVVTKSAQS